MKIACDFRANKMNIVRLISFFARTANEWMQQWVMFIKKQYETQRFLSI